MDKKKLDAYLTDAETALAHLRSELATPDAPPIIRTSAAFFTALDAAHPGDTLVLGTDLVISDPVTLTRAIRLMPEDLATYPSGRVDRTRPMPHFFSGLTIIGPDVQAYGVCVTHPDPTRTLIDIQGAPRYLLDRVYAAGHPSKGAKRGIAANGGGQGVIVRSVIDNCFSPYPSYDAQALYAQSMLPGLVVDDCYLEGGTETIMFGGGDPALPDYIPSNILISNSEITKKIAWRDLPIGCKNLVEFKNARNVEITHCHIANAWGGRGQVGFAFVLTPRNQGNTAPWSTVEDIHVHDCVIEHCAGAINILGDDDVNASQRSARVAFTHNQFRDMDPTIYTTAVGKSTPQMILIGRGPIDLAILNNTFEGKNLTASVYFHSPTQLCENLVITDNTWPKTKYDVKGDSATGLAAVRAKYILSGTIDRNALNAPTV